MTIPRMTAERLYRAVLPDQPRSFSLFWKVLGVILLTAAFTTVAIGLYIQFIIRDTYNELIAEQLRGYITLTTDDVGIPPNPAAIERLTSHYPFDIRVETPDGTALGDTRVPDRQTLLRSSIPSGFDNAPSFLVREYDGHYHAILTNAGHHFIVRLRSPSPESPRIVATMMLVIVLLLLISFAWAAIRRLMLPIRDLMAGVRAVGAAEFKHRVPVRSPDELGRLARAFNAMSEQIDEIIASKRRLLFDVSHELRTPLTRMNIAISMLPDSKARATLQRNANELNTMITELLENERLAVLGGALVVEEFDLVELVRKVLDSFGDDGERINCDALTETLVIKADSQRVIVALRNILSNALKYSAESEKVDVVVFPDDDGARIIIRDRGIGIPTEALDKIFEPFYRTDESRTRATGGYGLGLALTKSIIEAHGGTIQAESEPDKGTTITVWLPHEPQVGDVKPTVSSVGVS